MKSNTINLIVIGLLFPIALTAQSFMDWGKTYKYFVGHSNPDTAWKQKAFDDSNWLNGKGPIGYGDNDDTTIIDTTTSLYIRYKIDYSIDLSYDPDFLKKKKGIVFYIDYDDGFIAYLNGIEILRVNIDDTIHSSNTTLTNRSHEAELYRYNNQQIFLIYTPALGFYVDSSILHKCNIGASNLLAIEVHNDSVKGSDITLAFNLDIVDKNSQYSYIDEYGRYLSYEKLDSTILPIINIELDEFGSDTVNKLASMSIINNNKGYNKPSDSAYEYNGQVKLKRHGASSLRFPKRSFKIELIDSSGNNRNEPLLGMPKENDWFLLGLYADKSLISNDLTYALSRKTGRYEPRSRYCQLIVNGIPQGIYSLYEQIKRDKHRVDIEKLEPTENSSTELTGGYILRKESDEIVGSIEVVYPKPEDITVQQKKYIVDYFSEFQDALNGSDFLDPEKGYKNFADINSLADYIIFNELALVADGYAKSFYMYKHNDEIDNRIKFGPHWDYDNSYGGGIWTMFVTTGWNFTRSDKNLQINKVMKDSIFSKHIATKWFNYRNSFLKDESINSVIDSLTSIVENDQKLNYKIWIFNINGNQITPISDSNFYEKEIVRFKKWIADRAQWMDTNLEKYLNPVSIDNLSIKNCDVYCYPNPFKNKIYLNFNMTTPTLVQFKVVDITGRVCLEKKIDKTVSGINQTTIEFDDSFDAGLYFLKVFNNGQCIDIEKIIKQ
jgi:hypothetical protein